VFEERHYLVDDWRHAVALVDGEGATRTKIILHVHYDKRVGGFHFHGADSFVNSEIRPETPNGFFDSNAGGRGTQSIHGDRRG
jgi:hypothetical protein